MSNRVVLLGVKGGASMRPGFVKAIFSPVEIGGRRFIVDRGPGATGGLTRQDAEPASVGRIPAEHLRSDHYIEHGPSIRTAWPSGSRVSVAESGSARQSVHSRRFIRVAQDGFVLRQEGSVDPTSSGSLRSVRWGSGR